MGQREVLTVHEFSVLSCLISIVYKNLTPWKNYDRFVNCEHAVDQETKLSFFNSV